MPLAALPIAEDGQREAGRASDSSSRQEASDSGSTASRHLPKLGEEGTPLGEPDGDDGSDAGMEDVLDAGVFAAFDAPTIAEGGGSSGSGGGARGGHSYGSLRNQAMRKEAGAMSASQPELESSTDTAPILQQASLSPDGFFPFADDPDIQ